MRLELFGMIRTSADAADPLMISKRFFQDIKTAGFFRRYRGSMNNLHGPFAVTSQVIRRIS